jgi:hypothetical protein
MLTPKPRHLGLVIIGNCQLAIDAVGCRIIGIDPLSVDHLRLAHERGFGPVDLGSIEVSGDVSLEEAQRRAAGFEVGLIRVEKYFEGTHITAYAGPPPEPERTDYCWGGCPGAIEEAIEILRQFDADCDAKMPRLHVVFGAYEGRSTRRRTSGSCSSATAPGGRGRSPASRSRSRACTNTAGRRTRIREAR